MATGGARMISSYIDTEQMIETPPTPRVTRLLERWHPTGSERTWHPSGADEHSIFLWRYFTRSENEPIALRRAKGMKYVLQEIAIGIYDDELIVGQVGLEDVAQTRSDELAAARSYWRERGARFARKLDTNEAGRKAGSHGLSSKWSNRDGHAIPAFDMILSSGLDGLRQEAEKAASSYSADAPDYTARQEQWQAMIIALEALSDYIRRYAKLARKMAYSGKDRQDELVEIAEVCERIAEKPPRTFREALQIVWFVHLGIKMDDGGVGHSFGR